MKVRIHAWERASRANGPGLRAVVWFQGCTLGCAGCFNPDTHSSGGGHEIEIATLMEEIAQVPGIEGVSISGGEPFQQPGALAELASRICAAGMSVLVFSGYTLEWIRGNPEAASILAAVDVLVAGAYAVSYTHLTLPTIYSV